MHILKTFEEKFKESTQLHNDNDTKACSVDI